jgi:hypothetical protein
MAQAASLRYKSADTCASNWRNSGVLNKAMWRGRAEGLADKNGVAISVQWLTTGQMVISLAKPAKGKGKRK